MIIICNLQFKHFEIHHAFLIFSKMTLDWSYSYNSFLYSVLCPERMLGEVKGIFCLELILATSSIYIERMLLSLYSASHVYFFSYLVMNFKETIMCW